MKVMVRKIKKTFKLSTTHIILMSFLILIFIGAFLLSLPVCSANGEFTPFIDALFTSTTSVCVTGLVTVPTISHWSTFGHIVILFLIQIGGLGVITTIASFIVFLHKKMKVSDRLLIQDALNLDTLSGLTGFLKRIIVGTFIIEGIGALLYMTVFIPDFGWRGIWISIFNSISAFCNAGIDIVAENSLCNYATNPIVNFTTSFLIIMGGLGFVVWWDIVRVFKNRKTNKIKFCNFTLHTKIVLVSTVVLIFFGAVLILLFEYNNPNTIANLSLFDKIQVSMFQSITTRTAGFATIPQENLTNATSLICLLLMFIGGSPVGTAGGIKTVTFVIFIVTAMATIRNSENTNLFNRKISKEFIRKSVAVVITSFSIMFVSSILLSLTTNANAIDILYETVSATATVGLSRNLTSTLSMVGKIIIIFTMYFGRVGPISLAIAFMSKRNVKNVITNPKEKIYVG